MRVAVEFGSATKNLSLRGVPITYYLNAQGQVIGKSEGPVKWESAETRAFIESALK